MYVISVVPLKRGVKSESLSYFSSEAYPEGTLVTIPIRNKSAIGLVTEMKEVSTAKTALRAATFSLRKLGPQVQKNVLGSAYIKTAQELSHYYASSLGTILYNLLPPTIRDGDIPLPHTHHVQQNTVLQSPELFQATKKERYRAYRLLVRETFAHSGSILIVVPSSADAKEIYKELSHGITDRVILFATSSTKSELKRAYLDLEDFSKTKLIIATPSHAVIERHDIILSIIDHARSPYYKEFTRPYLDYRDVIKVHSKHTGRRLIFADTLPRTEEEGLRREEVYQTFGETPKRLELQGKLEVVQITHEKDTAYVFNFLSDQLIQSIKAVRKRHGNTFLFAARRGLAPLVTCMDCGYILRSKSSGLPYSLHRTTKNDVEERWFVCNSSGERVRASDTCTECGSWRLKERGIGIQQIYDALHKNFPTVPVILFDHITARSYKKASFLIDTFYKTKGSILLGTHMAIPYLTKDIGFSAIVNMDALLATPTWRLEEENLALLLALREITTGTVLVQTRTPETELLSNAKQGTVEHFYTEELNLRKELNYPHYATFIHLTWQGTKEAVKNLEENIVSLLKNYPLTTYLSPLSPDNTPVMHGLIRLSSRAWPDETLASLLRTIHPSVRIVINPDKII